MKRQEHQRLETLASSVKGNGRLPAGLDEVLATGLQHVDVEQSHYVDMLHEPESTWRTETGVPGTLHPDDLRP